MGMKRALLLLPIVFAVGCNDRDRTDVQLNAAVALTSAREAISTGWSSLSKEAARITADSSKSALEEARKQAAALQDHLSKVEIKNPFNEAQMDAAKGQMAKVDAALHLQELKEQSQQAVQNAIESGKVAQQQYESASKRLAELDTDYRELSLKLEAAQNMYDQASSALSTALEKAKSLAGMR